ncbi:hypothetical protein TIFTF001_052855, partial [Ficus carica]
MGLGDGGGRQAGGEAGEGARSGVDSSWTATAREEPGLSRRTTGKLDIGRLFHQSLLEERRWLGWGRRRSNLIVRSRNILEASEMMSFKDEVPPLPPILNPNPTGMDE